MSHPPSRSAARWLAAGVLAAGCARGDDARPAAKTGDSAAGAPPTAGASAGIPASASAELAYVTSEEGRTLTVIDAGTNAVLATIPVGTRPRGSTSRTRTRAWRPWST